MSQSASAEADALSVSALAARIASGLSEVFPGEVWVRGEIRDLTRARSGHVYYTLTDDDASLPVVLMSRDRDRVNRLLRRGGGNVRMVDGTEVRIRVKVDFYEPRGQLQLRMRSIDPAFTLGQLALVRAELLGRLKTEGIIGTNATIAMPILPLRIGLVTSAGSAAEADVVDQLMSSPYPFRITVADVRVQGPDAPVQVASAVAGLGRAGVDVVIVARGGGAATDLAAFDTEVVARAIAACQRPVVTGVGHETDSSVADAVAHTAAKTPTAAAQLVIGWVANAQARAENSYSRLVAVATRKLTRDSERLDRDIARLARASATAIRSEQRRIDGVAGRIGPGARRHLTVSMERLDADSIRLHRSSNEVLNRRVATLDLAKARVAAADPDRALARGWSITRNSDGRLVRDPSAVAPGSILHTRTAGGTIISTVNETDT